MVRAITIIFLLIKFTIPDLSAITVLPLGSIIKLIHAKVVAVISEQDLKIIPNGTKINRRNTIPVIRSNSFIILFSIITSSINPFNF